jgi:DNA-binding NtrC family response regulator
MQTNNNYFTFLGTMYEGNFEDAFTIYQHSKLYNTFSDYLKDNYSAINNHKILIENIERDFLNARLKENSFNISKTAKQINISRVQLCNKIVNLQIELPNRTLNYIQYKKQK